MRSCRSRRLVRRKGQAIYENREEVVITAHGLICFAADAQKARAGPVTRLKKAKHKKLKHNLILGMPTDDMHERKKLETGLDRTWLVQRNQILSRSCILLLLLLYHIRGHEVSTASDLHAGREMKEPRKVYGVIQNPTLVVAYICRRK
jgi:hypothetical protein